MLRREGSNGLLCDGGTQESGIGLGGETAHLELSPRLQASAPLTPVAEPRLPGSPHDSTTFSSSPSSAIASQPIRANLRTPLGLVSETNGRNTTDQSVADESENAVQTQDTTVSDDEGGRPRSIFTSWKAPDNAARKAPPALGISEHEGNHSGLGDEQDDTSSLRPLLSGISWRTPLKRKSPETSCAKSEVEEVESFGSRTRPARPDSIAAPVEPPQQKTPHPPRYRTTFGLPSLDRRLGQEAQGLHVNDDTDTYCAGLASGSLVEISGTPGAGKTAMVMQLAVRERLASLTRRWQEPYAPLALRDGEASHDMLENDLPASQDNVSLAGVVFIDTEGSVSPHRFAALAREEVKDLLRKRNFHSAQFEQKLVNDVLDGIHLSRCTTLHELLATLELLAPGNAVSSHPSSSHLAAPQPAPATPSQSSQTAQALRAAGDLERHQREKTPPSNTSLIIIDSVSYYFRAPVVGNEPSIRRDRALHLAAIRAFVARARAPPPPLHQQLLVPCIVATNQMALTFVDPNSGERTRLTDEKSRGRLQPSLPLRAWVPEDVASQHAWQVLLFRACDEVGNRSAQIRERPASLRASVSNGRPTAAALDFDTMRSLRHKQETYWQTWLPYLVQKDTGLLRGPPGACLSDEDATGSGDPRSSPPFIAPPAATAPPWRVS